MSRSGQSQVHCCICGGSVRKDPSLLSGCSGLPFRASARQTRFHFEAVAILHEPENFRNVKVTGKDSRRQAGLAFQGVLLWRAKPLLSNWRAQLSTVSASISRSARPRSRASQLSVVLVWALNILIDSGRCPTAQPWSSVRKIASAAGKKITVSLVCGLCRAVFRFIKVAITLPCQNVAASIDPTSPLMVTNSRARDKTTLASPRKSIRPRSSGG